MRLVSAFTRLSLLFLGVALLSIVVSDSVWDNSSSREVTTLDLANNILGDWSLALLVVGLLMSMAMIGAAYLVRDERIENLEWELKGGREND